MKKLITLSLTWLYIKRLKWRANRLHFVAAIKQAERKARGKYYGTGKRHYVYFLGGKYRVLNRKQVQVMKGKGVIKPSMSLDKMKGIQLYDTLGHCNSHPEYRNVDLKNIIITYSPARSANSK